MILQYKIIIFSSSGASPYSMGPASQGTPTPLLSPAPGGGPQDSMGYSLSLNGAEYSSPMSGSQVCVRYTSNFILFFLPINNFDFKYYRHSILTEA